MLLSHQLEAVKFLKEKKYAILADNMGLGKSLSSISACDDANFLLIICPAYLKSNWERELSKWKYSRKYFICSYEFASTDKVELYFNQATHVILDECHYIKSVTANRTKAIHHYIQVYQPKCLFMLSGTPAKNRVPELYSLLMLCSYGNTETKRLMAPFFNYWDFCDHFSWSENATIAGRDIVKYSGHRNLPHLKGIMNTCYLRRLKMDKDLPEMRDINIYLDLDSTVPTSELFEEFLLTGKPSKALASIKANNALLKAPHTAKFCKDLVEENQVEQIVIFCDHVKSIESIASILKVKPITGNTKLDDRDYIVQSFIRGDSKYLVTTIGTSSTGLNLTNAHVMVFNSLSWVVGDLEQAKKRTNRIGQDKDCLYYFMISGPIDEIILNTLNNKKDTLNEVL
jgi:SNF2 family DNA or RNA helicase